MFSKCASLKNLQINGFKTEKVKNMANMFEACASLVSLDFSNFDTSSVTNMDYMFYSCVNIKHLDLSKFNTSNVKSMMAMFAGFLSLESLDLSFFDISKTTNMSYIFFDSGLMIIDINNFTTIANKFSDDAFKYTPKLKYISLRKFKGEDIFDSLENNTITICSDDDTLNNLAILKTKNIINNCSDLCFNELSKTKEDKSGCEIPINDTIITSIIKTTNLEE